MYYPEVINNTTARFYTNRTDLNNRTNSIQFSNIGQGYHKFKKSVYTKTLRAIKVIDGGSGYTNRKLSVKPVGIHTISNTVKFDGHGFNNGDLVNYSTDGTAIAGLSTANQYYIIKEDDDSFKLANAGVGGTITTNYDRRYYETFSNSGVGYQNFSYPDIELTINATIAGVGTATQAVGVITATPIIRGEMVGAYLIEK